MGCYGSKSNKYVYNPKLMIGHQHIFKTIKDDSESQDEVHKNDST